MTCRTTRKTTKAWADVRPGDKLEVEGRGVRITRILRTNIHLSTLTAETHRGDVITHDPVERVRVWRWDL